MPIATRSSIIDISKEETTHLISKKLSDLVRSGDVIFFYGEIGVGKTTFIKYFINNLQKKNLINQTEIPSPTFTIINEYKIKELVISHYDLFKLKEKTDLNNIGLFEDYLEKLTLIEWPEIIENKPENRVELFFNYKENYNKRTLEMHSYNRKEITDEFK